MSQQFEQSTNNDANSHYQAQHHLHPDLMRTNSLEDNSRNNPVQFLSKFFDADAKPAPNPHAANKLRHFSSSISMDEATSTSEASTSRHSANRRLEEFRRVVESSYNQHVISKQLENLTIQSSRRAHACAMPQTSLEHGKSDDSLNNSNSAQVAPVESSGVDTQHAESNGGTVSGPVRKKSGYEIPYMSAYNIYRGKASSNDVHSVNSSTVVGSANLNETTRGK